MNNQLKEDINETKEIPEENIDLDDECKEYYRSFDIKN